MAEKLKNLISKDLNLRSGEVLHHEKIPMVHSVFSRLFKWIGRRMQSFKLNETLEQRLAALLLLLYFTSNYTVTA